MDNHDKGILGDRQASGERIRQAWEYAALAAMEEHRKSGVPVVTWDWDNNQILSIPADEVPLPDEHSLAEKSVTAGEGQ
jgi:hypothetical protein